MYRDEGNDEKIHSSSYSRRFLQLIAKSCGILTPSRVKMDLQRDLANFNNNPRDRPTSPECTETESPPCAELYRANLPLNGR